MHEFSIIQGIVDIVLETAREKQLTHISVVEVEVGKASGVIREAMDFAWEAARKDTLLSKAVLKIVEVPLVIRCNTCGRQYEPAEIYDICPGCGEVSPVIITGKELRVVAVET